MRSLEVSGYVIKHILPVVGIGRLRPLISMAMRISSMLRQATSLSLLIDDLAAVYKKFDNIIWFRLANGGECPLAATDGPYALADSGSCAESVIPLAVKSWPLGTVPAIPSRAIRENLATALLDRTVMVDYKNRLINALATLCLDCDVSSFQGWAEPLSAKDFNEATMFASQRRSQEGYRLVHVTKMDLMAAATEGSGVTWYGHYPLAEAGHWFGVTKTDEVVSIIDAACGQRRLILNDSSWNSLVESDSMTTWFRLEMVPHDAPELTGPPYELYGAAMSASDDVVEIMTPLTSCGECGAPLARRDVIPALLCAL